MVVAGKVRRWWWSVVAMVAGNVQRWWWSVAVISSGNIQGRRWTGVVSGSRLKCSGLAVVSSCAQW